MTDIGVVGIAGSTRTKRSSLRISHSRMSYPDMEGSDYEVCHTVPNELKAAGVDHEIWADLPYVGKQDGGCYSKASRLSLLLEAVNKIPIVTTAVRPAEFVCDPSEPVSLAAVRSR